MESLGCSDAADLISFLSSSLIKSDLEKARMLLASREKSLKSEMECDFFDELALKEVEKIEAKHQCDVLEREVHALEARCTELKDINGNLEEVMKRCVLLENSMGELQKEVLGWKKKQEDVALCVLKLMEENSKLRSLFEQNHRPAESKMNSISTSTPSRKGGLKIVSSGSEGEDGVVRIPTGRLIKRRRCEKIVWENEGSDELGVPNSSLCQDEKGNGDHVKRLLFPTESSFGDESPTKNIIRSSGNSETVKRRVVISDSDDADDNGEGDFGSESEGDSLGGFIVTGSDSSQRNFTSSDTVYDSSACNEDESTTVEDFHDVLSKLSGKREDENKWEYEADMLASFSKDTKLCMEAVCVLYRMQTAEEKSVKGTILLNNRGFSTCDAHRGSAMAEFLIGDDPQCLLRKSVKELKIYDSTGPDYCHSLASRYSKQLFNIYKNNEDPFFHPSINPSSG